ncbi:hypothetical protein BCR32DRAFT_283674 [Anaeromyces robustus]|uniref:Uncharacterized protein n=1 Tax=Anaeromyces robustus TaxID=1754192 RepID=A0A1Y1WTN8_9FUNG|nr:hypothetical protein BCR32DRAFT_283674 [Anaeromyces robustus]|eukprot:ORX76909.1 hypothetical protein BCR32DRAFT_283674 [Anaeromyces robustus]
MYYITLKAINNSKCKSTFGNACRNGFRRLDLKSEECIRFYKNLRTILEEVLSCFINI